MRDQASTATVLAPAWQMRAIVDADTETGPLCLTGPSTMARALRSGLAALASSSYPLVLRGAPGTGKRAFAEALHRRSNRARQPFLVLEFAGANAARADRTLADVVAGKAAGTCYVPAFDTLSEARQATLVEALRTSFQSGRVVIVVGTHADVHQLSVLGRVRSDLLSLLTVWFTLPQLRDRLDDVDAIAERCVRRWSATNNAAPPPIRPSATSALRAYSWPNNLSELEDIVASACTRAAGRPLTAAGISAVLGRRGQRSAGSDIVPLRELERSYIRVALANCGHNRSLAARRLGIGRNTLFRMLADC